MLNVVLNDLPFIGFIVTLFITFLIVLFKTITYKRFCFTEYSALAVIIVFFVLLPYIYDKLIIRDIIVLVISLLTLGYSLYDLYLKEGIKQAYNVRTNALLKNAPFDYYIATDSQDFIIDFSESFIELISLEACELYNTLAFQTLISKLFITHINGEEISNANAVRLNYDYMSTKDVNRVAHFELTVQDNGESYDILGVVEPVFFKNKFVGKNIYLSKNNRHTLSKIQDGLKEALQAIQDDRAQLYVMMSMADHVIMYYDYNTSTYVMTEVMAKKLNIQHRELNIEEFISIIHPSDIQRYQEQGTVISAHEVTRIRYRIRLNKAYYDVVEDAIYLNRDGKLISIIRLANYQDNLEVFTPTLATDIQEKKPEAVKVDYKEKLEDTFKILEKLLGE